MITMSTRCWWWGAWEQSGSDLTCASTSLTVKCCCKSRRVGATISCGTEFFREAFVFGTVPVCRDPPPAPWVLLLLLFPATSNEAAEEDDDGWLGPPPAEDPWVCCCDDGCWFSRLLLEPGVRRPGSRLLPCTIVVQVVVAHGGLYWGWNLKGIGRCDF